MNVRSRDLAKVEVLAENFQRHVVSRLIDAGLDEVLRYGFLIRPAECSSTLNDPPINHYLGSQDVRVTGMELKFTQRLPTEDARVKRGVNDFVKLIYLVTQSDEGDVHLGIDYQQYFEPALDESKIPGKGFDAFVSAGTAFYMKEFPMWLERFRHVEAA